jgi:hypothetical protein
MSEQEKTESKAIVPSLEENPGGTPETFADSSAPDVQFVLATYIQCVSQIFAKGGDTRYHAQGAMVQARQALGVLVALGIMESETKLSDGTALWLSPAVPPMGVQANRNATLQG